MIPVTNCIVIVSSSNSAITYLQKKSQLGEFVNIRTFIR